MNTVMFLSGMGVGSLLTILLLLTCLRLTMKRSTKWNEDTLALMRERNEIASSMLEIKQIELERSRS